MGIWNDPVFGKTVQDVFANVLGFRLLGGNFQLDKLSSVLAIVFLNFLWILLRNIAPFSNIFHKPALYDMNTQLEKLIYQFENMENVSIKIYVFVAILVW